MRISRREFLKYCTVAAGALGLTTTDLLRLEEALATTDDTAPHVVWLPGQACTGCTMSLANSVYYATVDDVLLNKINLDYNEQLVAVSGDKAVAAAVSAIGKPMVLALEGAIPHGNNDEEEFCTIWSRTGGIVAHNSVISGGTISGGTLVSNLTATALVADDVIKAGSELVEGTVIPKFSVVTSAADRAAMTTASFIATNAGAYGSDVMGEWVTSLAAAVTTTGNVTLYGGTDTNYPSGSTIGASSTFVQGTNFHDPFDREWLVYGNAAVNAPSPVPPDWWELNEGMGYNIVSTGTGDKVVWDRDLVRGGMLLRVVDSSTNTTDPFAVVSLVSSRALSGLVNLAIGSTLSTTTILAPGTRVSELADRQAIDADLSAFGVGASATGDTLADAYTIPTGKEIVLSGNIVMAGTDIFDAAGSLASTAQKDKTMLHEAKLFGSSAAYILCVGTCSSFGGIPAASGNKTGAAGLTYKGLSKPGTFNGALNEFAGKTVNIPGCPPHSDWIVGTIAYVLSTSLQSIPALEAYSRPMEYYGQYQCNAGPCEWRYNQGYNAAEETAAQYANPKGPIAGNNTPGTNATISSSKLYKWKFQNVVSTGTDNGMRYVGCIGVLGCKGRKTKADCSLRRWNSDGYLQYGSGWCVGSGAGCHGCTEPTFPDKVGKFFNFA